MKIERKFTKAGQDAYADLDFVTTVSEIRNPDGSVVFKLDDVEVPQAWSQVASDVIAQKYFRKAGVPSKTKRIKEKGVPEFLWRSEPAEGAEMGGETSAICWPPSAQRLTAHSGSTPVCIGPMASTVLHRDTIM